MRPRRTTVLVCAAALALVCGRPAVAGPPVEPRLVLVLAIDQLRGDRLDPTLPGGLGRLAREGRVFADAAHAHAGTETCPGHVVILTGLHPGHAGVPLNDWRDRETGREVYCVEDDSPDARVLPPGGGDGEGRSPRRIRGTTLGDWLQRAHPGARVFSVSGKDRAAIAMAGQGPDGAYWYSQDPPGGFTSSAFYVESLPDWVEAWHGPGRDAWLARLPERWEHGSDGAPDGSRPDDTPWEVARFSRVSGHPVGTGDREAVLTQTFFSPWLDELTLDFAGALVEAEGLGRDDTPDLLAIGLTATDTVGHLYGPGSQEARDALLRLDEALGRFLDRMEAIVGEGRLLVVLTGDHGVAELPEWVESVGAGACPVAGGRPDLAALDRALEAAVRAELGVEAAPSGEADSSPDEARWLLRASHELTVNRALARRHEVPVARVVAAAEAFLEAEPGVTRVWTAAEIERGEGPEPFATLYRNSHDPERSGDLVVQTDPTCVFSRYPSGTSHGTPHLYDRAVPVVFHGAGIGGGVVRARAAPVDIGPTLADWLDVEAPDGLDGRVLPLAPSEASGTAGGTSAD